MGFAMPKSRVYILLDDQNRITRIEGQYSLPADLTGWTLVEEGAPCDRLNLAQSHYLDGGLMTDDGIYRYKLGDGALQLRTDAEVEADRAARPAPSETLSTDEITAAIDEGVNSI